MKYSITSKNHKILYTGAFLLLSAAMMGVPLVVNAAPSATSELTQEITAGALSTDIRDGSGDIVSIPIFTMDGAIVSTSQQSVSGTYGSASQRINVDNPGGANGGWTLSWNATNPVSGAWTSGVSSYAYNGSEATGRLTVNPATATLTALIGGATGITLGSQANFSGLSPLTLITASGNSADIWNGYVAGIGLTQTIPSSQPAGSYSLDMTQTVTAT